MVRYFNMWFILITLFITASTTMLNAQNKGFYIQGRKIYDANDKEFIMRGVTQMHAWYASQLATALTGISPTKANCIRFVMSTGHQWTKTEAAEVRRLIDLCKQFNMVPILQVHDCTGYSEAAAAVPIDTAVNYWIELKDILFGEEKYVIINIANEPYGNTTSENVYVNGHKRAIQNLRNAGFKHLLMIDGANWGQDWQFYMQKRAQDIFDADPDKNTVFSIHMYECFPDDNKVKSYLQSFINKGLPLTVAEFGISHGGGKPVAAKEIINRCQEYGIGYIGWAWSGNSPGLEDNDISQDWTGTSFTPWGELLINSTNGIKNTSVMASVFPVVAISQSPSNSHDNFKLNVVPGMTESSVKVSFQLKNESTVALELFDLKGNIVRACPISFMSPGEKTITLNGKSVASGNYFVRLSVNGKVLQKKVALTR